MGPKAAALAHTVRGGRVWAAARPGGGWTFGGDARRLSMGPRASSPSPSKCSDGIHAWGSHRLPTGHGAAARV